MFLNEIKGSKTVDFKKGVLFFFSLIILLIVSVVINVCFVLLNTCFTSIIINMLSFDHCLDNVWYTCAVPYIIILRTRADNAIHQKHLVFCFSLITAITYTLIRCHYVSDMLHIYQSSFMQTIELWWLILTCSQFWLSLDWKITQSHYNTWQPNLNHID